ATLPFSLLAEGAAIIAVFWVLAKNHKNFRTYGSILLSGSAVAGVVAASIACFVVFPIQATNLRDGMLLLQRYTSMVMIVVLGLTRISLPRHPSVPIPVNARRFADILVLDAGFGVVTSWFARVYGYAYPDASGLLPPLSGLILGTLWLLAAKPVEDPPVIER